MKTPSPTLEGLGAILHRPACGLAEISWRWSFGLAAGLLLFSSLAEYLNTLSASRAQLLLLKTRHPVLVLQALAAIFRGSAGRVASAVVVLVLALALAWIVIASIGRASSLDSLLEYFRERGMSTLSSPPMFAMLRSLFGLYFLRVTVMLAAIVASLGAVIISAASVSRESAALASWLLLMLVGLIWSGLNWLLSLAPIFVAAGAQDTFGSIGAALSLYRERRWSFFAIGAWFNFGHFVAFVLASFAVVAPFLLGRRFSGVALIVALVSLFGYFAVMDFLYVGRLAAYLSMTLGPPPVAMGVLAQPTPDSTSGGGTRIDPDELILSDLPLPDGAV
jgi:hypothetical protein